MKIVTFYLLILVNISALASEESIHWRHWSQVAFDEAKKHNQLMLINVGHEGCIACRWMKEQTFTNPEIIKLINDNFIAIQVDSEMQPDIGERYSDWAWPATAFNKPDGTQVLAIRGNRSPERFGEILRRMIEGKESGTLVADKLAPYGIPSKPRDTGISKIRDQVRAQLDSGFDNKIGGWEGTKILEYAEPILAYSVRAHLENDSAAKKRFMQTANGFLNHLDSVWGGLFYESLSNWKDLIFEKRLETQAAGLQLYATAYQLTGDKRYANALKSIHRYLHGTLRSKSGLYFASQQANLIKQPENMTLTQYYQLDDNGRRAVSMPTMDRSLYTDLNARIITGLVNAYEATNNENYLTTAIQTAGVLIRDRKQDDGSFIQFKPGIEFRKAERIHKVLNNEDTYLRPQGYLGLAFMDLYRATADNAGYRKRMASLKF